MLVLTEIGNEDEKVELKWEESAEKPEWNRSVNLANAILTMIGIEVTQFLHFCLLKEQAHF